jgi:DNA-binding transcriptional ArsR family regulator
MVYHPDAPLDAVFGALADPTRRAIVRRLAGEPASVSDLARPFAMSLPAVTKHLAVLERAGLVHRWQVGRVRYCRLTPAPMRDAAGFLAPFRALWEHQLDNLAAYLGEPPSPSHPSPETAPWPLPSSPPAPPPPTPSASSAASPRRRSGSSPRGPRRRG